MGGARNPVAALELDGAPEAPPAPPGERDALRLHVASHDYGRILFSSGALVAIFSVITYFTESDRVTLTHVNDAVAAGILVTAGLVIVWGGVPLARQPWVFAGVGALFLLSLLYNVTLQQTPVLMTYVAVVLGALGPCTLAWRPYLAAVGITLSGVVAVTATWPEQHWVDWTTVCVLSACVGCLLLSARLRGINALADTSAYARELASVDQLTGLLNRHGFMERISGISWLAHQSGRPLFVVFVDIEGLKQANDRFGHEFGDKVIQRAAEAVRRSVRESDVVVRWGGDEFVVAGPGRIPDAEDFNERLQAQREWAGDGTPWAGALSVGFAEGLLDLETIDDIIGRADEDMYRRRAR